MTTHMPQYGNAAPAELAEQFRKIHDTVHAEVERAIKGKSTAVRLAITCFFAGGHLLIEDMPGLGKTLAREVPRRVPSAATSQPGPRHRRPAAVGPHRGHVFDPSARRVRFRQGPMFNNVVLVDEINRAAAEDAVRAARGHGGAPGHRRRRPPVPSRSWSSRRRTRFRSKAPTRCPSRSSTAS